MRMKSACLIMALAFALLGTHPEKAAAQVCNFSNTGINFGTLTLDTINQSSSTGTITANCSGTRGRTITICPNIGSGTGGNAPSGDPRYMTSGPNQVPFNIYQTNGIGQVWGSYVWPFAPRPPSMSVLIGNNGNGAAQRTVNARLSGVAVPAGLYTSNFSGGHTLFDYGYAPNFRCSASTSSRATRVPFVVQVNNTSACQISTTPLDFGAITALTNNIDATNTISVNCSPGVRYTVSLSNGTSGATSPAQRRMTAPNTADVVSYGIYTNANRTTVWGTNGISDNGNGQTKVYTGYGRIPAQPTPDASTYADTVTITVTY